MPRPPRALPPELGVTFSCAAALAAGATPRRLRSKALDAPFTGVRTTASPRLDEAREMTPDERTRVFVAHLSDAFAPLLRPGWFSTGRTAAVLFGAPIAPGRDLTVGALAPARAPRRRGVKGVKVSPHLVRVVDVDGRPLSTPASTWAILGSESTARELVILGDFFVRVPRPSSGRLAPQRQLATVEQLHRAIAAGARPGIARLREAVEQIRVGSSSPLETEYRIDAEAAGLPVPDLDVEIRDGRGRLVGITEVAYTSYRVLVEIEGDHHRTDRAQWNRDIEKYNSYNALGWEVVRLTSAHVRGARRGVTMVRDALLRRGWRPDIAAPPASTR